jgi:4a-hydroxytetrahydrobiopterin dehydratase
LAILAPSFQFCFYRAGKKMSSKIFTVLRQTADPVLQWFTERKEHRTMAALAEKECVPCKGGVAPLKGEDLSRLAGELRTGWQVVDEHHLEKEFKFKDFREALKFTNKVGELAEAQGHHPDIYLAWGKVRLTLWTHKIDGLTESDFVMAAKIDRLSG